MLVIGASGEGKWRMLTLVEYLKNIQIVQKHSTHNYYCNFSSVPKILFLETTHVIHIISFLFNLWHEHENHISLSFEIVKNISLFTNPKSKGLVRLRFVGQVQRKFLTAYISMFINNSTPFAMTCVRKDMYDFIHTKTLTLHLVSKVLSELYINMTNQRHTLRQRGWFGKPDGPAPLGLLMNHPNPYSFNQHSQTQISR